MSGPVSGPVSGLEVLGRDAGRGAWRVAVDVGGARVVALVPEAAMGAGPAGAPRHQTAYEWLGRNAGGIIARAVAERKAGRDARAPFEAIVLAEET